VAEAERVVSDLTAAVDAGTARRSDLVGAQAALTMARAQRERHIHETSVARAEWGRALGILDKLVLAPESQTGADGASAPVPDAGTTSGEAGR
jgi:outer membrane protein TolC